MDKRPLGHSGLSVAPLCFGGNVFGWTVDEPTSFALLDAFVDAGFDFIDTADVYSRWAPGHTGGESETVLGNWFARSGKRDRVVLATKVGMDMGDDRKGLSRRWIERAVEDSLRRLRTDRIDLYQSHQDDADTPQHETLEAYDRLIRAGKVRAIGAVTDGRVSSQAIATLPGVVPVAAATSSSAARIAMPRGFRYFLATPAPRTLLPASASLRYLPVRNPAASA